MFDHTTESTESTTPSTTTSNPTNPTNPSTNQHTQQQQPNPESDMSAHRTTLEAKISSQNNSTTANNEYISPSDAIMSPASQKLAGFKQRQISRKGGSSTARSLFAKQMSGKENVAQGNGTAAGDGEKKSLGEGLGG